MRNRDTQLVGRWWMWTAVVASAVLMNSGIGWGQDAEPAGKSDDKAAAAASAEKAPASDPATIPAEQSAAKTDEKSAAPAADATPATPPAATTNPSAPDAAAKDTKAVADTPDAGVPGSVPSAPPSAPSPGEKKDESSSAVPPVKSSELPADKAVESAGDNLEELKKSGWSPWIIFLVLVSLFVLPMMAGNYLGRIWKMPDHAWKFSLSLGVLAGCLLVCTAAWRNWGGSEFKFGPDLAGGITLIYELQDAPQAADPNPQQASDDIGAQQLKSGGREFTMDKLTGALKKRLDPDGTKEITIREYGSSAVEIIIPEVGQDEMEFVEQMITKIGQLEFRITADPDFNKDRPTIELAKLLKPTEKGVKRGDETVARWVPYDVKEFGMPDGANDGFVKRMAGDTPEILVLIDLYNVTGEYLTSASKGFDQRGLGPAVHFSFNSAGARLFEKLTSSNLPNPATGNKHRRLGILLDNRLVSAPNIESTISDRGQISGGSMTDEEVKLTVEVLDAGSLPAALNKSPLGEEVISPTLGGETVDQAKRAIIASMICVVAIMLVYYRFAGIVACLVLTFNLLLVLALMVLIKAAFTLPGLAGLALTIGMSVDGNVLIYERMREELKSGAALRMAIRNGFSRAMSAIIDSNVTVIISGIALFYFGTDQVKGFAVTLILGVLTSMFTSIFVARLIFDVMERRGWITNLRMMRILSEPNFDFLGVRWIAGGLSLVLILIGMTAIYFRGWQLLDIDFTGGTSVTFTLNEANKMPIGAVRDALLETPLAEKNLLVVERGETNTRYAVDTSEQSVDTVKEEIDKRFAGKLMTYSLEFSDLKPFSDGDIKGTEAKLAVNTGAGYGAEDGVSYDAMRERTRAALAATGHPDVQPILHHPNYRPGSAARFKEWTVRLVELEPDAARGVLERLQGDMRGSPLFPMANKIGGRVSSNMQTGALYAIFISLLGVIGYLWVRFQNVAYGLAAAAALVHDVILTVGMLALSKYVVDTVPGLASALQIESFQIGLTVIAALLTIIGYQINDTIVTFDRLREIKGKSPRLTAEMVNASVNQTLSRTLLTATFVLGVVLILYFFGGDGIHAFAFCFLIGVVAGTFSTIYIAAPVLLWLSGVSAARAPKLETSTRRMQPAR